MYEEACDRSERVFKEIKETHAGKIADADADDRR